MKEITYLITLILVYFSGCSTAYYKTEGAFNTKIDKKQPLLVVVPDDASLEEINFGKILEHLMIQDGYSIVDNNTESREKNVCGIFYKLDEPTYKNTGSYTTYNTSTSHTNTNISGFVGGYYVSGRGNSTTTTTTPQTHTYTYYKTYKKIYIDIGCLNNQGKIDYIWNGFASAEIDDYRGNQENTIKNLVELIQENKFQGNVRIDIDQSLKWVLKNQKRKNYLTISTDVGLGFADGRMESISLAPYGYSNFLTLDSLSLGLVVPITIRAGYTREFNNKSWSLGINTLYIMGNVGGIESETSYSYPDRYSCYDNGCPTTIKDNRIGIEAVVTKNLKDWGLFAGFGITKNISSAINIVIKDSNGISQNLTKKLDSLYPIWRVGTFYTIPATNLSITWDINGNWSLDDTTYIGTFFATNLGLLYKI